MPSSTIRAGRESKLTPAFAWPITNPDIGRTRTIPSTPAPGSFGIMQIEAWWALSVEDGGPRAGFPRFDLSRAFEPVYNIWYGLQVWRDAGWRGPWLADQAACFPP